MPRRSSAEKSAPSAAPRRNNSAPATPRRTSTPRRNNPVPPRPRNNPAPATADPPRAPTPRRNNPVPPRPRNNPAPATVAPHRNNPVPRRNNPVDRSPRRAHVEDEYSDRRRSRSPSSGGSFFGTVGKAVVAYSIVRSLATAMSPHTNVKEAAAPGTTLPDAWGIYATAFMTCVSENSKDIDKCQRVMDRLSLCHTKLAGAIPAAHTTDTTTVTK